MRMHMLIRFNGLLWDRLLTFLLPFCAAVCLIAMRGQPFRSVLPFFRDLAGCLRRKDAAASSQRRIVSTALAATMGTGNLVGTALALTAGGAGAVFWMWISALLGMVLVCAENILGLRCRRMLKDGTVRGGTVAVLRDGIGSKFLAAFFCVCCAGAGLGMGNLTQSSTIAQSAAALGISPPVCGLVTAAALLLILRGGRERIGAVAVYLMPLICLFYFCGCGVILVHCRTRIPGVLMQILRQAFGLRAAGGGITAAVLMQSMAVGIRRGIFSNEAGLGTSAILHMNADPADGLKQGRFAAFEVFADTAVCCTVTALTILCAADHGKVSGDAAAVLLRTFSVGLGVHAGQFLAVSMAVLAFATMIGWYPCGCAAFRYLFGKRADALYFACYLLCAFAGAFGSPEWIWAFSDCCNGLMALPNLLGILRLLPLLQTETAAHRAD